MSLERLLDMGFNQLDAENYEAAIKTANKLIAKKSLYGYGIKIAALCALEDYNEAIALAEAGIERFPGEWLLHLNHGRALMHAQRLDEAEAALGRALEFEEVAAIEVNLALAELYALREDWERIIEVLSGNEDWGELETIRIGHQLSALLALERWSDVIAFTEDYLEEMDDEFTEAMRSTMLAARAMATLHGKKQPRRAENLAWDAIRLDPSNELALAVVRRGLGKISPDSQLFALGCEIAPEGDDPFICTYAVIADTLDEAFNYVDQYEAQLGEGTPTLIVHEVVAPLPDEPCGLVEVIGDNDDE